MTRQVKPHQSIVALGNNPIDIRLLRYGELLMSYAECLVEVGGASAIPEAARYVDNNPNLTQNEGY